MKVITPGILAAFEEKLQQAIGKQAYDLWFANCSTTFVDGALRIGAPNRFLREWLESHFKDPIRQCAEKVLGGKASVQFFIDPELFAKAKSAEKEKAASSAKAVVVPSSRSVAKTDPAQRPPQSRYALSKYVTGAGNQAGYAAALALVNDPRHAHSPLVLFGSCGLGKTHLLYGAEMALREKHPDLRVLAISCEEFANQFVEAVKTSKVTAFRKRFRNVDVLLVDDVHFLSGKKATQEEFLHTMNALQTRGGRLLLTCDSHPHTIPKLLEELASRFVGGIVSKLEPAGRETRSQIVKAFAKSANLPLTNEVAFFLADNLRSNVSELRGAIHSLAHYCETFGKKPDLETARATLASLFRNSTPVLRVQELVTRACRMLGLQSKSLRNRSRTRSVAYPRMLILFLARKHTSATFQEIGQEVGQLNHSSVIAAEKKVLAMLANDESIQIGDRYWRVREAVEAFEREIGQACR